MPPKIVYDTTGTTSGTTITFGYHAEAIEVSLVTKRNRNVSDGGQWETVLRFTEKEWEVKYNYASTGERAAYETFYTGCASKGESFLFWPTAAATGTYHIVKLKDDDFKPRRFAQTVPDKFTWTHTYRNVV